MKKTLLITASLFAVMCANAQQFWIENWTGATARGQLTYTGPNGAWSVQQTGTNNADSNAWYFSNQEEGMGRTVCGTNGGIGTAHMGNTASAPLLGVGGADNGAIIDDGANTVTNLRLQSPVINCTGKLTISLSFNYIEGESAGHDGASVWYFDGTSWALLATPPTLDSCASSQGKWTYYKVALPASANNNANVRIGFNWTNDAASTDDNTFSATFVEIVSFAVDSVVLSTPLALSVNNLSVSNNVSLYPNPNNGKFNLEITNYEAGTVSMLEVYNMLGEKIYAANVNAVNTQIDLSNKASGVYMYRLINETGTQISTGKFIVK
jgi:hypothetical protein